MRGTRGEVTSCRGEDPTIFSDKGEEARKKAEVEDGSSCEEYMCIVLKSLKETPRGDVVPAIVSARSRVTTGGKEEGREGMLSLLGDVAS
jgi:hypothetical protein